MSRRTEWTMVADTTGKWVPAVSQPTKPEPKVEAVYFLVDEAEGTVKVGRTTDTVRRLRQLQTGSYKKMRFLGYIPGGARAERMLHEAMADHHVRGEWYKLTPEVRVLIDGACAAHRLSEDASAERDLTLALEASLAILRRGRANTK